MDARPRPSKPQVNSGNGALPSGVSQQSAEARAILIERWNEIQKKLNDPDVKEGKPVIYKEREKLPPSQWGAGSKLHMQATVDFVAECRKLLQASKHQHQQHQQQQVPVRTPSSNSHPPNTQPAPKHVTQGATTQA